jgi:hypothetical protein
MAGNKDTSDLKAQVIQELRDAIKKYGAEAAPRLVRERYPDVAKPTWYRWLKEVNASPLEVAIDVAKKAAKHLPSPPSPAYVLDRPVEARKNFNLMGQVERLASDAELLRSYSMRQTEGGGEAIKIPTFFAQSINLRCNVIDMAVRLYQQVYDMRRMQNFYDACLEEIAAESPDVALRITERLAKLNSETGMTIDAQI